MVVTISREEFIASTEPIPISGCWIWKRMIHQGSGYGRYWKQRLGKPTEMMYAHRLSWILFRGQIPDGLFILHRCDVRSCVNPTHLFLGTIGDNNADMKRKGRHAVGRKNGVWTWKAKLTEESVREIRASPLGISALGRRYGVKPSTIANVRAWRIWRWVT